MPAMFPIFFGDLHIWCGLTEKAVDEETGGGTALINKTTRRNASHFFIAG